MCFSFNELTLGHVHSHYRVDDVHFHVFVLFSLERRNQGKFQVSGTQRAMKAFPFQRLSSCSNESVAVLAVNHFRWLDEIGLLAVLAVSSSSSLATCEALQTVTSRR